MKASLMEILQRNMFDILYQLYSLDLHEMALAYTFIVNYFSFNQFP